MSRRILKLALVLLTLFGLQFSLALAQSQQIQYQVLAPLDNEPATITLPQYIPFIINLSIGIAAVMAFVMITFGGITYATTDALQKKQDGRKFIENAIIGLLLVISAWVILNTINPQTLDFSFLSKLPTAQVTAPTNVIPGTPMTPEQLADDANVRSILTSQSGGQVVVALAPCASGQTKGCTNVNGLPVNAIDGLTRLSKDCNCQIIVTGGTEGGHVSHGPGKPVVDLRSQNSALTALLSKFDSRAANPFSKLAFGVTLKDRTHANFSYETAEDPNSSGAHWHVSFGP